LREFAGAIGSFRDPVEGIDPFFAAFHACETFGEASGAIIAADLIYRRAYRIAPDPEFTFGVAAGGASPVSPINAFTDE
jgi:hypothetical protein